MKWWRLSSSCDWCLYSLCDQRGQESSANLSPPFCLLRRVPTPAPSRSLLLLPLRGLPPASLDQWLHTPTGSLDPLSLQLYSPTEKRERESGFDSFPPPSASPPPLPTLSISPPRQTEQTSGKAAWILTILSSVWMGSSSSSEQEWWRLFTCSYWNLFSTLKGGNWSAFVYFGNSFPFFFSLGDPSPTGDQGYFWGEEKLFYPLSFSLLTILLTQHTVGFFSFIFYFLN